MRCRRDRQLTCSSLPFPYGIIGLIVDSAVLCCIWSKDPRAPAFGSSDGVAWDSLWRAGGRAASVRSKQQGQGPVFPLSPLSPLFPLTPTHPLAVRQIKTLDLPALVPLCTRPLAFDILSSRHSLVSTINHSSLRLIPSTTTTTTITLFSFPLSSSRPLSTRP